MSATMTIAGLCVGIALAFFAFAGIIALCKGAGKGCFITVGVCLVILAGVIVTCSGTL